MPRPAVTATRPGQRSCSAQTERSGRQWSRNRRRGPVRSRGRNWWVVRAGRFRDTASAEERAVDVMRNESSGSSSTISAISPRSASTSPRPTAWSQTRRPSGRGRDASPSFSRQRSGSSLPRASLRRRIAGAAGSRRRLATEKARSQAPPGPGSAKVAEFLLERRGPEGFVLQDRNEALCRAAFAEACVAGIGLAPLVLEEGRDPGTVARGRAMDRGGGGTVRLAGAHVERGDAEERRLADARARVADHQG